MIDWIERQSHTLDAVLWVNQCSPPSAISCGRKYNNLQQLCHIQTSQLRKNLWVLACRHCLCLLYFMHPHLCTYFPVLSNSIFQLIIGRQHTKTKYSWQECGYHKTVSFVFWPQTYFILVRPIFMSKYVLLKYSLVLAKVYQGSDSYSHSYAQTSAEEVTEGSFNH